MDSAAGRIRRFLPVARLNGSSARTTVRHVNRSEAEAPKPEPIAAPAASGPAYAKRVPFAGSTARAFDTAVMALTAAGFRVVEKRSSSLRLEGPGTGSTKQSALLGASAIRIEAAANTLSLAAELGGVRRMARFIWLFPPALCVGLFAGIVGLCALVAPQDLASVARGAALPLGINAALWLVIAPVFGRMLRKRTAEALDALLNNMAAMGEGS